MTGAALEVPDRKRLATVQALCEHPDTYDYGPGEEDLFVRAMAET